MSVENYYEGDRHSSEERRNSTEQVEGDMSWSSGDSPSPTDSTSTTDYEAESDSHFTSRDSSLSPPSKISPSKSHPYRSAPPAARPLRPRGLGFTPLANSTPNALPLGTGALPKAQPLARTLFARKANDVPHAGMTVGGKKKGGSQTKVIVPTKGFRTTFELGLTASELARR